MNQIERALHQEIDVRLRALQPDLVWLSPPNGIYIPAHTAEERAIAARIVKRMKTDGQMTPGAPDMVFLWGERSWRPAGAGCIELKREASQTLLGRVPAGKQSEDQIKFQDRCERAGVHYAVCRSWDEVKATLIEWGALPSPIARIPLEGKVS